MADLNLKVQATDLTQHQFVPAQLSLSIGKPNDDLQTCEVSFELTDDGDFDKARYKSMQRIHKGTMNVPINVIAILVNTDGTLNISVFNQWLSQSALRLLDQQ
jgi:hypothetical protein